MVSIEEWVIATSEPGEPGEVLSASRAGKRLARMSRHVQTAFSCVHNKAEGFTFSGRGLSDSLSFTSDILWSWLSDSAA